MKYIRTKYGVYEVYAREKCPNGCVIATNTVRISYSDILREADTIEELCDEFVMADNSNNKPYRPFIIYGRSLEKLKQRQSCNENLYGAIWTDKGLQFVARMNNERELELL